jgi:hypothetical protein
MEEERKKKGEILDSSFFLPFLSFYIYSYS